MSSLKKVLAIYAVFLKRRRKRSTNSGFLRRVLRLLGFLFILIVINSAAMIYFEKMNYRDALWLSSTTVTTVGYGDFSPTTVPGRLVTVVTMYVFAISILSLLVAETVDWRVLRSERKRQGYWEWKHMAGHIQVINTPNYDTERYLKRMIKQIKGSAGFEDLDIQILTRKYPDGLPESIRALGVLHRTGAAEEGSILSSLGLDSAKFVIILARDSADSISDSLTFDILCRVKSLAKNATIIVESVLDENRQRFLDNGAHAVLRPVRAYPELIVRAMAHPGSETVLENLFQYKNDFLARIDCEFVNVAWKDIIFRSIEANAGTPLAYIQNGVIHTNPNVEEICTGNALISLVNSDQSCEAISFINT